MPSETSSSAEAIESEIYDHLSESSALEDLHAKLLFSLQRAGWAERIQSLSAELLRAGRCSHFDDMVDIVVTLATGQSHPAVPEANSSTTTTNGHDSSTATVNGHNANSSESFFRDIDVRIPKEIVEQGVRALKDSIRTFVTIEDDEDGTEADGSGSSHDTSNNNGVKELSNGKASSKSEKKNNKSSKDSSTGKASDANPSPTKSAVKDKKSKSGGKDNR